MNNVGRILLIVGAIVLAFLVGVLVGRGQRMEAPDAGNTAAVQITTTETPPATPPPPLPASTPPPAPPPVAKVAKVAPDTQVQEDAAAVGMTTRPEPAPPRPAPQPPAQDEATAGNE